MQRFVLLIETLLVAAYRIEAPGHVLYWPRRGSSGANATPILSDFLFDQLPDRVFHLQKSRIALQDVAYEDGRTELGRYL